MLTLDVRCHASVKSTSRSGRLKVMLWVSICTLVSLQRRSHQLKGRLGTALLSYALWPQASVLCSMAKRGFSPLTLIHSGFLQASSPENSPVAGFLFPALWKQCSKSCRSDCSCHLQGEWSGGQTLSAVLQKTQRLWEPWVCLHMVSKLHQFRPPAAVRGGLSKIQGQP